MSDGARVADLVHVHSFQQCLAGLVVGRNMAGAVVHIYYGSGPDHVGPKHALRHRPAPDDREPEMSWHWPKQCPWDR